MSATLLCWKCGASLKGVSLPFTRRDECPICHAELHVCRMCRHYDPQITGLCRHDYAEPPRERERANFCDYFKASLYAYRPPGKRSADQARKLAELFGEDAAAPLQTEGGSKRERQVVLSEDEKARRELERLFGEPDK